MPVVTFNDIQKPADVQRNIVTFGSEIPSKSIVSFGDLLPKETQRQKLIKGAGGSFDLTREEQFGTIKPTTILNEAVNKIDRWGNVVTKALMGDIPFVRKLLPESTQGAVPLTEAEKKIAPLVNVARDISLFGKAGRLASGLGKATGLTKAGGALTKIAPKTGRLLSKIVPEALQGGLVGAATAGSENPVEIAKKGTIYGGLTGATRPAIEIAGYAGKKVAGALAKSKTLNGIAEWLGTRLKETPVNKLIRERYGDIHTRLIDSEVFISGLEKQLTEGESKILPYLIEKKIPKEVLDTIPKGRMPELQKIAGKIRIYLDEAHADMMRQYGKDIGFIENYVPHIWDIPKNKEKTVINSSTTRNPHLN
jgi:hypothetical protein